MTEIRDINDVKGSVFDLPHAMSLPSDDCNVLLVSSRTLFFLQKFSLKEIGFNARYAAEFLAGDRYILAQSETNQDEISEIVNNYGLEVMDMTCDLVSAIEGITFAIQSTQTACGCPVGQGADNESGEEGGAPPGPIGDIVYDYPDPGVTDRKCKASNSVYWSIYNVFVQLDINRVDEMGALGLVLVVGLIGAIIGTVTLGPIGGLFGAVAGVIATFAGRLLGVSIDLGTIVTVLEENEDDLICALFEAISAEGARDAFQAVLVADGRLTDVEVGLIMLFLPNAVTNIIFFSVEGSESFFDSYVSPNDCSPCTPNWAYTFDFTIDEQGWTNNAVDGFPYGVYVPGVGWSSVWAQDGPDWDERLHMRLEGPWAGTNITFIETEYILTGTGGVGNATGMRANNGGSFAAGGAPMPFPDPAWITNATGLCVNPTDMTSTGIGKTTFDGECTFVLTRVTLHGTGVDPF